MNIKKRLYFVLIAIFVIISAGSIGYYILFGGKPKFMDCIFMTVISLTSVGYGEILPVTGNATAQIFTMILITFGMGILLYGISSMTALLVEGDLTGILRKKQMDKEIKKLNNHYIVCGGGETGCPLLEELIKNREQVVLIELDEKNIERCSRVENLLYIKGDATDDQNLLAAGIERAAGIIIALPSDKDNLYITMTARMLNKKIRIISRMTNQKLMPKLKKAGADSVVSPNFIGALRMASEMIRPAAVDFLDSMLRSRKHQLRIHEITVSAHSNAVGKKISESGIKDKFNLLILGAKQNSEEIEFNPSPSQVLKEGMILIVMGKVDDIARARKGL
ncbi:MAG: potassium channel protein [Desulfobacterales bacterium]|uniref:Potassium channel protein n=1 Tax=Candidatus Desulfaltia bathyphila TaxID=2841697 RepID=A0A8J6TAS5_9BACT|nr:potassium channel protein [Candidatus Desulfaltia bathyphila]MBL7194933.1 potassium channel protein [Desulfobacterales bacterium]MBL7207498.1 potassium channel protein [Desulfobacterales bacterium]